MYLEALRGGEHLAAVIAVAIWMRIVVVTVEGLEFIERYLAKLALESFSFLFQMFSLVMNEESSRTIETNLASRTRYLKCNVRFKLIQFVGL